MSGPEKAVEIYIFPDDPKREPNVPTKVVGRENEIPNLSTAPPRTQRTLMRATTPATPMTGVVFDRAKSV